MIDDEEEQKLGSKSKESNKQIGVQVEDTLVHDETSTFQPEEKQEESNVGANPTVTPSKQAEISQVATPCTQKGTNSCLTPYSIPTPAGLV